MENERRMVNGEIGRPGALIGRLAFCRTDEDLVVRASFAVLSPEVAWPALCLFPRPRAGL